MNKTNKLFNLEDFSRDYKSRKIDDLKDKKALTLTWYYNINNKDYNKTTRNQINSLYKEYKSNIANNINDWTKFETKFNKLQSNNKLFALRDNNIVGVVNKSYAPKVYGNSINNVYIDNINDLILNIDKITNLFDFVGFGYNYINHREENYRRGIHWVMEQCNIDSTQISEFDFYNICASIQEHKQELKEAIAILDKNNITLEIDNDIDKTIENINNLIEKINNNNNKQSISSLIRLIEVLEIL